MYKQDASSANLICTSTFTVMFVLKQHRTIEKNRFLIFTAYLWIPSSIGNTIPPNALLGGRDSDGSPIYVGRSTFQGDELPCKIVPNQNAAYVSYDGAEHLVERFDVKPVQIRFGYRKQ